MSSPSKLPAALASLAHTAFRRFWILQLVSLIGIWMQITAQGWLVYDLTSSKFLLGVINAVGGLPILFLSPFGGVIADRFNRKHLLVLTQIIFSLGAFLIGVLISTGQVRFWNLTVIAFIGGVVNALDSPARMAFFVELIDIRSLSNAIALNSLAFNFARILGPALAGYLVGAVGIEICFYLNATAFLPAIIGMRYIRGSFAPKASQAVSVGRSLKDGARYIGEHKDVLYSLLLVTLSSIFVMPFAVLMPVFARDILKVGPQGLGTLMAFTGFGAFIGSFLLAQFSSRLDFQKSIYYSTLLVVGSLSFFAFSTVFAWSCLALALLGLGVVVQVASINTYIQNAVSNELRGRVMSFYTLCFMGFMPVGALQAGVVSQALGAPFSLALGAVVLLLPVGVMLLKKKG
jgi:MFS family permease